MPTTDCSPIEEVLGTYREEAAILERAGHGRDAEVLRRVADEVSTALGDYLRWLSEAEAAAWCDRSERWLRERFPAWEWSGDARRHGRHRQYRASVLPRSVDVVGVREEARRLAGEAP